MASTVIVYENDTDNNEITVAKIQAAIMFASKRTVGQILEITLRTAVSNYWLTINKTNRDTIGECDENSYPNEVLEFAGKNRSLLELSKVAIARSRSLMFSDVSTRFNLDYLHLLQINSHV